MKKNYSANYKIDIRYHYCIDLKGTVPVPVASNSLYKLRIGVVGEEQYFWYSVSFIH